MSKFMSLYKSVLGWSIFGCIAYGTVMFIAMGNIPMVIFNLIASFFIWLWWDQF